MCKLVAEAEYSFRALNSMVRRGIQRAISYLSKGSSRIPFLFLGIL